MKKELLFLLPISIFFSLLIGAKLNIVRAAESTLYFSPASQSASLNQTKTIKLMVNVEDTSIDGITANFTYPSDKLTYVSYTPGATFDEVNPVDYDTPGEINYSVFKIAGIPTGTYEIATITFRTKASGTATLSFTTDADVVSGGSSVLDDTTNGTITISSVPVTSDDSKKIQVIGFSIFGVVLVIFGIIGVIKYKNEHKQNNLFNNLL